LTLPHDPINSTRWRSPQANFNIDCERHLNLLAGIEEIRAPIERLSRNGSKNLIIDITSFPKMWFFPMVAAAMTDSRFENVIVTYCSADDYADHLSENVGALRTLPGFFAEDGRTQHDSIIIGIGFEPLGLLPLLSDQRSDKIRLIFPFPPGPPGHRRNWMFVKQIEELTEREEIGPPDRVHIHMYDCPQVFDALCTMTNGGRQTSAIGPYGPKTVSLAMCLFAIAAVAAGRPRVPVYYAQPLRYSLDYSIGIAMRGEAPDATGYCLKLNGRILYSVI
jgi:hypothetical protein